MGPDARSLLKRCPTAVATHWVPEGSLAGFLGGAFLRSGRPRGPGKAFKNAEGEAPNIFEGFPGLPEAVPNCRGHSLGT